MCTFILYSVYGEPVYAYLIPHWGKSTIDWNICTFTLLAPLPVFYSQYSRACEM